MNAHNDPRKIWGIVLTIAVLGVIFYLKAEQNYLHHDYVNSNFFSFWLAGRMAWAGESPYDPSQWLAGFDAFGATYRPSRILQYPLPLMYFMAPIGWLPPGAAYVAWQIITQAILAVAVYVLLHREGAPDRLLIPLVVLFLFFGPAYLTLQIGTVGAISLLGIALAIQLYETDRPLFAGFALSILLLKPPQALPILLLTAIWLLARKDWKVFLGLALGGVALLAIWVARDPLWLAKFRGSSDFLLGHSLGVQSNTFGIAYWACRENVPCMWIAGSIAALVILAGGAVYLWRDRAKLHIQDALALIIPLGFMTALYLYSYDQLLYMIPVLWIALRLLQRSRSYVPPLLFLIAVDIISFIALYIEAVTHNDLPSGITTIVVLGASAWLLHEMHHPAVPRQVSIPGTSV